MGTRPATRSSVRGARRFVESYDAGASYVYLNYGMYWLTNVLIKDGASNGFVLLRALRPDRGIALMKERRSKEKLTDLCSGPGKLSMAFGIVGEQSWFVFRGFAGALFRGTG